MGERVRTDAPLCNAIIPDSRCRAESFLDVTLFQQAKLSHFISEHSGKTVGLQLHANLNLIGGVRVRLLQLPHLTIDT